MKIVINKCYGGFGLSPKGLKRLTELQGRSCYFYKSDYRSLYVRITDEEAFANDQFFDAFDVPELDEKQAECSEFYRAHNLDSMPESRIDPLLIQVIEELGTLADGPCAKLRIVEIPDGTKYQIDEYDGNESIHEIHQSWD